MLGFGIKKKRSAADGFDIPSFPLAVLNLLTKLRNPDISTNELAADLEIDPGLHVRVLKMVNSAAFGLSRKVSNIQHAISLLGRSRLESLVLSVAVKNGLSQDNKAPWLDMAQFWTAASRRAAIARGLAIKLHPQVQSDVFTIGLLQDIGVLALANREGNRYRDIYLAWQKNDELELCEQERHHFSIDHATLGAQMAESWEFPTSLIEAIRGHHGQEDSDSVPLSVKIAALLKGQPDIDSSANLAAKAEQRFELESNMLCELIDIALTESQELSAVLN